MPYLYVSSSEVRAGERITVAASEMTYEHMLDSNYDYYFIRIYVDGAIQFNDNIDYGRTGFQKAYTIPSNATNNVKIYLYQWIAGVGDFLQDSKVVSVIPNSSGSGSGSGGGSSGGSTSTYDPTIGSFTLKGVKNDGTEIDYAVQGKTKIKASVSGCTAGSGYITAYAFYDPYTWNSTSSTSYVFNPPSGSGSLTSGSWSLTYGVRIYNSAGRSTYASKQIQVYPYSAPYFTKFNAYRSNASGTADINGIYITCECQVAYSSVNNTNKVSVDIWCNGERIAQDIWCNGERIAQDIWCNGERIAQDIKSSTYKYTTPSSKTYSIDSQHSIYAIVSDEYSLNIKSVTENIYPSGKILNIAANGQSMGIGGLAPSDSGSLKCYWDANFVEDISVDKKISTKDLSATGNVKFTGDVSFINKPKITGYVLPEIQTGSFDVNPNQETGLDLYSIKYSFDNIPFVSVTAATGTSPNTGEVSVFVKRITETECAVYVRNHTNTVTTCHWIAVYAP